jgi:glycosyltransferase involved in cell wall biosynthesis
MIELSALNRSTSVPEERQQGRTARVAYFVSHPIQYQVPLLRRIATEPDIEMTTFFSSDLSVRGYRDAGFGVEVKWDVPLLEGYKSEFLPRAREADTLGFARPLNWGIMKRLQQGRFDVVWVFGYNRLVNLHAIAAANLLRLPVILRAEPHLHSHTRSTTKLLVKSMLMQVLKCSVDCLLSIGDAYDLYWKHYFGQDIPMYRMPYAVDNDFFRERALQAAPHREELRRSLGLESGRPIVLYASKLQSRKRCIDLVEAFIRLSPGSGIDPPAYLLIVGDGEERASLEARVRDSGLSSIRFLGFRNQTELPALYDLCDAFVLPSYNETWGLIVNEVMNAGRAIIVTDQVGCHYDLVHDGVNGYVIPLMDVAALSDRLRRLIEDPSLRAAMGENSLRIIQQYSFRQDIAGLRQAIAQVVPGFRSLAITSTIATSATPGVVRA